VSPVRVAATGKDAELVDRVPITRSAGQAKHVVLSMASGGRSFSALPDLKGGDRLTVLAEVEVTTDWPHAGPGCVASPYTYAPTVTAELLLAASPEATEAGPHALALGKRQQKQVTQTRHHHVFVFPSASLAVPARGVPWAGARHLNLVVGAHNAAAASGQVLLVGQNEPDGTVDGNQARLNAVRFRSVSAGAARTARSARRVTQRIPVEKGGRAIVYSLPLKNLRKDEQLVVSAELQTSAHALGYPARISTELVLAASRTDSKSGRAMKALASPHGEITKFNGFNCLPDSSSCITEKVGVLRVLRPHRRELFINLVAVSASPTHAGGAGDALEVQAGGYIQVQRFDPTLLG
jgi:hypothetical protein